MRLRRLGSVALLIVIALPLAGSHCSVPSDMPGIPRLVLWAWEKREHLESIDPNTTAVAYLSRSVFLAGDEVVVRPRMQPLFVPPATALISVVRIETTRGATLSPVQRARTVDALVAAATAPKTRALQIDFDATTSERAFYKALLHDLRPRVGVPISITALASWCMGDDWLATLPINEAVPMMFRLGPDKREAEVYLESHGIREPLCAGSIGLSTDEPRWQLTAGKRVYIFHPRPWSSNAVDSVVSEVHSQQ